VNNRGNNVLGSSFYLDFLPGSGTLTGLSWHWHSFCFYFFSCFLFFVMCDHTQLFSPRKTFLSYCRLSYTYKSATQYLALAYIACWCRHDSQFMQHCIVMLVGTLIFRQWIAGFCMLMPVGTLHKFI